MHATVALLRRLFGEVVACAALIGRIWCASCVRGCAVLRLGLSHECARKIRDRFQCMRSRARAHHARAKEMRPHGKVGSPAAHADGTNGAAQLRVGRCDTRGRSAVPPRPPRRVRRNGGPAPIPGEFVRKDLLSAYMC